MADRVHEISLDSGSILKFEGAKGFVVKTFLTASEFTSWSPPTGTTRCSTFTVYFSPVPTMSGSLEKLKVFLSPGTKYSAA